MLNFLALTRLTSVPLVLFAPIPIVMTNIFPPCTYRATSRGLQFAPTITTLDGFDSDNLSALGTLAHCSTLQRFFFDDFLIFTYNQSEDNA